MNNYCTNCGKKLEKDALICKSCNTPIIDLPYNYVYKSPQKRKRTKKILKIIGLCILCIFTLYFIVKVINKIKVNQMQKEYAEPYLKENYNNLNYSIKYDSYDKCIVSGNCYFDPAMGCDGGSCEEYKYLEENDCKSYYYSVKTDIKEFILTVVDMNNQIYVVEGKNIYGKDKENSEDTINNESNYNSYYEDVNYEDTIDKYPYESNYYTFDSMYEKKTIYLDNNFTSMSFFTGKSNNNNKLYIFGNIENPTYLEGNVYMTTKYYDQNYNEIGICNDTIKLSGGNRSNISFSCHVSKLELTNNENFEDVTYYKISISSLNINE